MATDLTSENSKGGGVRLIIPGVPIAKARPRFAVKKMKNGKSFAMAYGNQKTEEGQFLWHVLDQLPKDHELIDGPIALTCSFRMPRLKSHYGTGKNSGALKKNGPGPSYG